MEASPPSECPACRSTQLVEGELIGGGELFNLPASTFRPRSRARLLLRGGVELPNRYMACCSCGLFWQTLDREAIGSIEAFERVNRVF